MAPSAPLSAYSHRRTLVGSIIAAVGTGRLYLRRAGNNPLSQDATLSARVAHVAAIVPGRIVTLDVDENQKVKKGDLLFALDPEPYRLAVDQARADLKIAEAARDTQRRTIAAEESNAGVAGAQVTRARANLALAEQTLARLTPLLPKGYVTAQQVDDARTSLAQAIKQAEAAGKLVNTLDAAQTLVEARRAALAIAERNLANTEVRAPHDGRVVGLSVATGEIVAPGQAVFTLIDTGRWYASASFDETELPGIKAGDCARVYAMADRSRAIAGMVEGIGWGVISGDLVNISQSLPYVPKSLNWVRIMQRFPVRIRLIDPPEDLMRIGASAVAIVHRGERC